MIVHSSCRNEDLEGRQSTMEDHLSIQTECVCVNGKDSSWPEASRNNETWPMTAAIGQMWHS